LGWWVTQNSFGDLEPNTMQYISEKMTYVFKGEEIPKTNPKDLMEIKIRIDLERIPFLKKKSKKKLYIKMGDYSGENYIDLTETFLKQLDGAGGCILIIDPTQDLSIQQETATRAINEFIKQGLDLKNKKFAFIITKSDIGKTTPTPADTKLFNMIWSIPMNSLRQRGAIVSQLIYISALGHDYNLGGPPEPKNFEEFIDFFS